MISDPQVTKALTIQGHEIPVWIYGDEKNPAIFFVHGYPFPFSHYTGDLPIRYLMNNFCIYTVDLPGYGKSKKISLSHIQFVRIIEKEIIQRPFIFFGVSYGGLVSLQYAVKHPKNVLGIIMAGTPTFNLWGMIARSFVIPRRFYTRKIFSIGKNFLFLRSKESRRARIPILLLYSKKDKIGTVKMSEWLAKHLKNAKLVTIDNRSHGWLLHRVDQNAFLGEIKSFLASTLAS